jgi:SHAQKYF class myb-like DNA-binding protein
MEETDVKLNSNFKMTFFEQDDISQGNIELSGDPEGKKLTGRWTREEHQRFVDGLKKFGKNWKKVEEYVGTRTGAQIRSHAQKFFNRVLKENFSGNDGKNDLNGFDGASLGDLGSFQERGSDSEEGIAGMEQLRGVLNPEKNESKPGKSAAIMVFKNTLSEKEGFNIGTPSLKTEKSTPGKAKEVYAEPQIPGGSKTIVLGAQNDKMPNSSWPLKKTSSALKVEGPKKKLVSNGKRPEKKKPVENEKALISATISSLASNCLVLSEPSARREGPYCNGERMLTPQHQEPFMMDQVTKNGVGSAEGNYLWVSNQMTEEEIIAVTQQIQAVINRNNAGESNQGEVQGIFCFKDLS